MATKRLCPPGSIRTAAAFDRLCKDAFAGKFDIIAAWSIFRLGCSLQHLTTFLAERQSSHVNLFLLQQQIDTTTAAGRAFHQIAGVLAAF